MDRTLRCKRNEESQLLRDGSGLGDEADTSQAGVEAYGKKKDPKDSMVCPSVIKHPQKSAAVAVSSTGLFIFF